jgi:predicted porin
MHRCVFAPASPASIVKAAVAQTNVNIYAVVDACISTNNDDNPGDKSWDSESGRQVGSRVGFKAGASSNAGMSVSYGLQKRINAATGAFAQSHSTTSHLYGRQTWGGASTCYLYRPMSVRFSCYKSNTVTDPIASGGVASEERDAFIGAIYDFGAGKAHIVYADKKLPTINGDGKDLMASETCNQVRDMASVYFDRYAVGYTYLLPICTNIYTSYSTLKNEDDVALATNN